MTFLPIIERELRLRARGRTLYRMRFAAALVGLVISVQQATVTAPFTTPAVVGRSVFNGVVAAAFLLCCSASLLAADTISSERRQGTLGLLFLTSVRGFDVLFAKFVSGGLVCSCALIAFLPALMIPVLAGGVAGAEALRKGLALLATLLFALSAGLFGSAARRARAKATCLVVGLVVAVVAFPFLCYGLVFGGALYYAGAFSPLVLAVAAGDPMYRAEPAFFWWSLVTVQGLAWVLLAGAGLLLRRAVQADAGAVVARSPAAVAEAKRAIGLTRWRPDKEDASPIEWVVYREHGVGAGIWAIAVLGLVCSRWMSLMLQPFGVPGGTRLWVVAGPLGLGGALVGGAMVAWVASRFFARVRLTGELDLLLTTPVGAERIVSDQWLALRRAFVVPVPMLQVATAIPMMAWLGGPGSSLSALDLGYVALFGLPNLANTLLGTAALCWTGLLLGLKAPSQPVAILWTVALAQGVPWLIRLLLGMAPVLPELAILGYYAWLIPSVKRHLLADLAGVEPLPFCLPMGFGFE